MLGIAAGIGKKSGVNETSLRRERNFTRKWGKQMKTAKRLLALLLVLAMTLSNLPVGVLAAEFQELAESAEAPAETTQATEAPTEAPVTEAPAEVPTEASTEAPTEAAVEAATEEATEEATEAVTEAATGPAEETEAAEVEATAEAANETEAAEEEETHDPYLSFFDLEENEDGELRVGNTEIFGFGMCQPCGAKRNVIFYLNTWNEETGEYDAEPVHVTAESNITVTSITDAEFEDGQPSDYFVTICTTAWDTSAVVSCGDVTLVFGTQRAHIHFFSEAEISNETVMYDLNADEQNVFYIGFTDYDDGNGWSDVHLADFCAEYAELEYVSDVLYKITLKDNARDFVGESGWAGVLVLYTWTAEGETYGQWQPFFMTPNPYLTYGWLEMDWDRENGAYYEGENHGDTGFNVVPEQFHFQIYYLHAWDEEQECMVETPVAVEDLCCDSSAIAINAAKDFADIRDGEENADCFARIGGLEWGAESEIYVNLNGERVQGVYCNTFLPEWACYSSAEISYSTFTSDYCVDPYADENAFYVGLDSDHWSVKGDAYVNEDWEDLLSVQSCDTDNMFKIVLTDYAMEGVLRGDFMWPSILVDVVDGDGNTETWETGLFVYANDEDLLTEPYLSMAWLEYRYDEGQDMEFVYEPENDDAKQGQGFNICLGNKYSMIYYLNVWDADQGRYVAQPVMPKCDGSLIFNPVDNAGEGEENSAYFVQVSTNASEPEDVEVYVDYEGQRYSFVATIALHNFALYESEEMNFDTYLADEETLINVDLYGENYVYAGFQGYEDWELVDIYVHPESEGYVELEAVEGRDDLWKLTVTQEGINRNLYQYLLGIGVCAELQNVNDENWTETRECWFTLSRMELETYGWMHISGGGYTGDFEIIDGGYIYYYETDDEDAGSILMTELPEGLTYDQTTNTLTMDNFDGEWMGFSAEVLPSDSLTIELIGDNSLINSACTAFEACDGLNVTITGDGSLYVKTTNDYFQDDGGNAYVDDTWRMNGGRLTIKGNASVTIEAAGEGNESCWDENGNKLGERTGGVAVLSMGHGQLYIKDNAYLKTVIPEGAQRNGAEDVGEDNAIWDDRFPGGFRGIADASLFVSGGTLVTQSLECQSGYNDDGSIWINNYTQTGGSVTIQATGWNSYTDEGVFHTHYEGLSIRQDCSAQISGGTLTVEVEATPAQLASSTYYEAIMVRGGELTISGAAEVTVSANHENGSLVGVSCEYGEEGVIATGSLTINGGTLNVNGAKGEGNGRSGIYCDFDTVFTMTDGTINSEYADFMNHGPAHISGGTINIGGQYLYDTWFDENGNPVAWITGFHAGGPGFTIDGGEINVTNGHFIAGGMIAVNGGVINIENGKLEVDAGFGFNDGEINITNNVTELTEAGYFWPSLEVNTYFSMGGTEDDENKNPTLTIDHNIDTYAVYVTGTYHQMNGTVDFGTDCEGYCFKVLRTYEDEEVVGHGTLLLNGGTIHAEGPLYDESVSEWDDSNKAHTTFIDLEPECEMQLNGATIDVTRARLNLGGTGIINDGAINGYDTSINLDNEAIINGGTIDLDAWSLLFANGMVAMNGGVIDLSNTIMQVNGGFSLNDGEIIIDNTNEELFLGYNTLCLYVGCYMSIGGSEIENANPTLTVKQSMEAPAVIVEGTMHLMDGTVEVTQPATGAPAVYLSEAVYDDDGNPVKTDDDGNPIGGEFLVNGGQLTINSAEEGNCAGIVTAPTSVYFMNGGIADLNGTNLVVGGQMYLYDKAVLNVNDGIVELCDGSYTELDYGKLNLDANGQIIEGATAAFLTEAGSQVLMKNGQINVDSHVYDCTMEIRGTYTQRNGALNVDSSVVGLFLSDEADISDGIVFVNGGYVVVNSGDTADALNLNDMVAYSLDSGKHLLPVNYTIMFDESGNATEDPAQASTIRYIVNFEEDNTPGNLDTEEGVDRVSNMVIVTGKSGNHTTWDLTDGLLTFGGDGGMYDYITETAPWYWLRNFITGVEVDSNMGYLGAYAFDGLSNDVIIRFLSYAPSFSPNAFNGFSGDARYPLGRDWTTDMLKDYGGDVTWILDQNTLEVIDILTDKDVLLSGQKTTLTARLYPEVDAKATVVWSLAEGDENYASLTVKKNIATVTAKTVTEKNVVTVYAVVKDGLAEPIAQEVTIYPMAQSVAIYSGETNVTGTTRKVDIDVSEIRLTAEVTPDDYAVDYSAVTWSSSKPAVADVDENGIVSFTGTAGTAKITAAAADGSKKTATVTFTVADLLDGFEISGEKELVGGKSATYKALNEDTGKALKSSQVTWSMDAQYAPYASITAAGKLTTKKVMEAVDVTLTATLVEDPEIVREIVVTIYPAVTGCNLGLCTKKLCLSLFVSF